MPITGVLALEFMIYSSNRKQFYKAIWVRWAEDRSSANVSLLLRYNKDLDVMDYGLIANIMKIHNAFRDIDIDCSIPEAFRVYKKYWQKKIIPAMIRRVKNRRGVWPVLNTTQTIAELISRGWVHRNDAPKLGAEGYYLYSHVGELVYNQLWYQQQDALEMLSKVGIPGRTGVKSSYKKT